MSIILCLLIFGCSQADDSDKIFDKNSFPQEWKLVGMSGGLSGSFFEGAEMPWQETITLQSSFRFIKVRQVENRNYRGTGAFTFTKLEGENYLILEYDAETELIESCSGENLIERLFMPDSVSLNGGSAPCDGPGLYYEKIE